LDIIIVKQISIFLEHELKSLSVNLEKLRESDFEDLEVKVEKICCNFCEEKFFIPANLDLHVRRKHQSASADQPVKCFFCEKVVPRKGQYRHIRLYHKKMSVIRCKYKRCLVVFKSEESLQEHLEIDHFLIEGKQPIECKFCPFWFSSEYYLRNHMKAHLKKGAKRLNTATCIFCNEGFENNFFLYFHTKKQHREAIRCTKYQCRRFFKTKEQMLNHCEKDHKNMFCQFCSLNFTTEVFLHSHLKKMHSEKRCKFNPCKFYTDSQEELKNHVEENHDKNVKLIECVYSCGTSFTHHGAMCYHIKNFHSKTAIKCDFPRCRHYAKSQADLEEHKKEAHKKVEKLKKTVICLYCQKEIWDNSTYAGHIKRHHSKEAIRCKYNHCCTYFKSQLELEKHDEEKHNTKYKCAFCDYNSFRKENLEQHFQNRHFPRERKCPHCPKMLGSKRNLTEHLSRKHKPKPKCPHCKMTLKSLHLHVVTANCPVCSRPFPCRRLLTRHKKECKKVQECLECGRKFKTDCEFRYHVNLKHKTGQKWKGFECEYCNTFCDTLKSLRNHRSSEHFDLMKFRCAMCDKAYFRRKPLWRHIVTKHDIGGVQCKECGRKFLGKTSLIAHMLKKQRAQEFVECADCGKTLAKSFIANHYIRHQNLIL